jgi:hypothetical protein
VQGLSLEILPIVTVIVATGWDYVSVELRPLTGTLSTLEMIHDWIWSSSGMIMAGENRRTQRETCPSATLSTTNPTWTNVGAYPHLRSAKPATNRLSYDTTNFIGTLLVKNEKDRKITCKATGFELESPGMVPCKCIYNNTHHCKVRNKPGITKMLTQCVKWIFLSW